VFLKSTQHTAFNESRQLHRTPGSLAFKSVKRPLTNAFYTSENLKHDKENISVNKNSKEIKVDNAFTVADLSERAGPEFTGRSDMNQAAWILNSISSCSDAIPRNNISRNESVSISVIGRSESKLSDSSVYSAAMSTEPTAHFNGQVPDRRSGEVERAYVALRPAKVSLYLEQGESLPPRKGKGAGKVSEKKAGIGHARIHRKEIAPGNGKGKGGDSSHGGNRFDLRRERNERRAKFRDGEVQLPPPVRTKGWVTCSSRGERLVVTVLCYATLIGGMRSVARMGF
jgi:hypothetical protein